jgi:hypothetical protein
MLGPTFFVDAEELDFGIISYGFVNKRSFVLNNTSEIPMVYKIRILCDGKEETSEFIVDPSR